MGSMLSCRHLSAVEATSAITSQFCNYKSTFSIILFALVNAKYNFLFIDVYCQERISDGGVFRNCELYEKMEKYSLGFPPPAPLTRKNKPVPYFLLLLKIPFTRKYNESLPRSVSEGISRENL
jgi:hypothetical protein